MNNDIKLNLLYWIFGGLMVFIYAKQRFNTPTNKKSLTTRVRYNFATFSYVFSLEFLFLLLGGMFADSLSIIKWISSGGGELPQGVQKLPGPLLSALLLTTLLPNIKLLAVFDKWLRESFQTMGNIPWEAIRLRAQIRQSAFEVPEQYKQKVMENLPENFQSFYTEETELKEEWEKITSLYVQIIDWNSVPKYNHFVQLSAKEYNSVIETHKELKQKISQYFTETSIKCEQCKKIIKNEIENLHRDICNFIAKGILRYEMTRSLRERRLREMGFINISHESSIININQIVSISGIVFLIMLLGMVILGRIFNSNQQIQKVIFISSMVATIYGVSIFAGIYPKTVWSYANRKKTGERAAPVYLLSGGMAVVLSIIVSLTFKFLLFRDFMKALEDIWLIRPWLSMSCVIAIATAFFADDFIGVNAEEPSWLRWLEGAALGVTLIGASWLVREWLIQIPNIPKDRIPGLEIVLPISGVMGLLIGLIIPHAYRAAIPGEEERSAILHG